MRSRKSPQARPFLSSSYIHNYGPRTSSLAGSAHLQTGFSRRTKRDDSAVLILGLGFAGHIYVLPWSLGFALGLHTVLFFHQLVYHVFV